MQVGETYEVHWPHSAAGACGTPDQYQTPFYDGVFCNLDEEKFSTLSAQDVADAVGVQAQVFTVVNDERYFYPDLMRGFIKDGEYGKDIAMYTGSTTGTTRSNEVCSSYAPISELIGLIGLCRFHVQVSFDVVLTDLSFGCVQTSLAWQVDRKCHLISASSFDRLCETMRLQRDNMTLDMHAHVSHTFCSAPFDVIANDIS
jgi:hypothetical protein